ncbi:MAG: hypothetical protein HY791_13975 [Deltaproteobacteria bacterium]|nr:hypothetical protein [Deltaproteobacteria bacterium]
MSASAACLESSEEISLGNVTYAAAFTVSIRSDELRPSSPLFSVVAGSIEEDLGALATEQLSGVVGLTAEQLAAISPYLDVGTVKGGVLREDEDECEVGLDRTRGVVWSKIPLSATLHTSDDPPRTIDTAPPLSHPTLEAPLSEKTCESVRRQLTHLGGVEPIAEGAVIGGTPRTSDSEAPNSLPELSRVVGLADGRVVALGRKDLFVLRPGEVFSPEGASWLPVPPAPITIRGKRLEAEGFGVGLDARDPDDLQVIVVAAYVLDNSGVRGAYFRTELGPEGFRRPLELVVTSTDALRDVAIDPSGRVLAVGEAGTILTANSARERPIESRTENVGMRRVVFTGSEETEYAIAAGNGVLLGDPRAGFRFYSLGADAIRNVAAAITEEGLEIWVLSSEGKLLVRRAGADDFVEAGRADLSSTASPCATAPDPCGHFRLESRPSDLGVIARDGERFVLVAPRQCGGPLMVRMSDGCGVVLGIPPESIRFPASVSALEVAQNRVLVVGGAARVYEIPLSDLTD